MAQFVKSMGVVLLLVVSLAVVASAAPPRPSDWKLCDSHANYDVVLKNVSVSPDPVISGEDVTFIVPAYTKKDITKGSVVVSVSFHGITVHTERSDICSKARCPIPPGEFVLENTEILPGFTPPGSYKIKLQFVDESDKQLACADINFSIVWSQTISETLESLNPIKMHKNPVKMQAPVAHT
uniref:MD-2-related lipid-recognition domain-containing protein n=2 Tax=Physcomitrium patens TaxID=3218 RepID=A0A2K1JYJ3_PHYPA|nr:putative phosphatidylglycerol/phosphatidylinositol transfer protein DDB_G0278295 [Physcomitrium patens]PNR46598.1 hypothetical protein PHYPA_013717 [Physcomitrium patens]|eukprot:XP_024385765.1 putative phosphatidylglycerol/phosphatidylinositol transfer protein DDB_G0278295 [Physcomitrella patens]